MRGGYRWHEFKLTRRRWITWQMPFTRPYSIAWTQKQIDQDVARAVEEYEGGLIGESEVRRRFEHEERYDSG